MIVLDTNVISELMKESPSPVVLAWLDAQKQDEIWTTAISIFESRQGLATMPVGKKKTALTEAFEQVLHHDLGGRVLELDEAAASRAASVFADALAAGRPIEFRDALIAGTVAAQRECMLATRNTKHFEQTGVGLVNPWGD